MDAWLKRAAPANATSKTAAPAAAAGQKAAASGSDVQPASNPYDGTFPKIKVKSTAAPPGNNDKLLHYNHPARTNTRSQIPLDSHGSKSTDRRALRT